MARYVTITTPNLTATPANRQLPQLHGDQDDDDDDCDKYWLQCQVGQQNKTQNLQMWLQQGLLSKGERLAEQEVSFLLFYMPTRDIS